MDVRRSNIPCRVTKSVLEKPTRSVKSPATTEIRRTPNSVTKTTTEVKRSPNSVSSLYSSTEVKRTPNSISATQTSAEVKRTPNSISATQTSAEVRRTQNSVTTLTNSISRLSTSNTTTSVTPASSKPSSLLNKSQPAKKIEKKPEEKSKVEKPAAPIDPNLIMCHICGRHFNPERIGLHQNICKKTSTKKRRPFDPVKHRLQGTEAEDFLKKPKRGDNSTKDKKANWRKKHEEFISIVRAAREAQAYVAKGGKLSDLPPPPSMNTDDLKPCPHCGRKFNEGAAERHIPKCANIRSNKPLASKSRQPPGRK